MTAHLDQLPDSQDQAAVAALRAAGYQVPDIQSLAKNQAAFAVRVASRADTIAPGVHLETRTVELADGCFTNTYALAIDLPTVHIEAVSAVRGFHLPDLMRTAGAVAAVSGSFSFISDDPAYQPAEPCLDLCVRDGEVVSLPTVAKPAVLVRRGQPVIRVLNAVGTLRVAGQHHRWTGSKAPHAARQPGTLTVFGAANCNIRYTPNPRTGLVRDVDPDTNLTPADPAAVDYVVAWTPRTGHRVTSIHSGGGADLFAGNFVLRVGHPHAKPFDIGAPVRITGIDGIHVRDLDCGFSLGPNVTNAAAGDTPAFDACLGDSPFRDRRCARTLIGLRDQQLWFLVADGAPLTDTFQGVSPTETAAVCAAHDWDPHHVFHLDGGQTSKIAVAQAKSHRVLGSMHYLRWPRVDDEPFRWQGQLGRILHSGFAVRSQRSAEAP